MKKILLMALLAAMMAGFSTSAAFAQRGGGAKLRGDFGHGFWNHYSTPAYRSTMSLQATPMVESNRNFSYEPMAAPAETAKPAAPCTNQPAAVENDAQATQRFSYEPSAPQPVPTYSYRSVERHKPSYMYPKTDSRRYQH